jgi:cyclophilin family peptidyl-prolyl cis-trans isomerase
MFLHNVTQTVNITCVVGNPTAYIEKISMTVTSSGIATYGYPGSFEVGANQEITIGFKANITLPSEHTITISVTVQEMNGVPPFNQADSTNTIDTSFISQFGDGCATYGNPTFGDEDMLMNVSWIDNNGEPRIENITLQLDYLAAPLHSNNFRILSALGCYDNVSFHRVINNFMIQSGDFTNGDGTGGHAGAWYGYCNGVHQGNATECNIDSWSIPDEANNGLNHTSGALSMAKTSAAHTGGSQFFIVPSDSNPSHLNGVHTVFGYVTDGLEHIDSISDVPTGAQDVPTNAVTIEYIIPIVIVDSDGDGVADEDDAFPQDANESSDSDGDGVGDNSDAFPQDSNETNDDDGDGVGNNSDAFPQDANETHDDDGDGVGNNSDAFPQDENETIDSDGDGVGDNSDFKPNDPSISTPIIVSDKSANFLAGAIIFLALAVIFVRRKQPPQVIESQSAFVSDESIWND